MWCFRSMWHVCVSCQDTHMPERRKDGAKKKKKVERKKREKRVGRAERAIFVCWRVLLIFPSVRIRSTVLTRPNQTCADLTSHQYCHYHQTEADMLIVYLISATPSVAFLPSTLHISISLQFYTAVTDCHTKWHGRGNDFLQRSSLLFFWQAVIHFKKEKRDPMMFGFANKKLTLRIETHPIALTKNKKNIYIYSWWTSVFIAVSVHQTGFTWDASAQTNQPESTNHDHRFNCCLFHQGRWIGLRKRRSRDA